MNKATIIENVIMYIDNIQHKVQSFIQEPHQLEATSEETTFKKLDEINSAQHTNNFSTDIK